MNQSFLRADGNPPQQWKIYTPVAPHHPKQIKTVFSEQAQEGDRRPNPAGVRERERPPLRKRG
jgi:hypothetical protein